MYCTKCGRELPGGGTCVCGAQVPSFTGNGQAPATAAGLPQQPPMQGQAAPGYIPTQGGFVPPPVPPPYDIPVKPFQAAGVQSTAITVLRQVCTSTLALTFLILSSISTLLSVANGFMNGIEMRESSVFFTSAFLSALPGVLCCAGLWLFYVACRQPASQGLPTAGLTLYKTGMMIVLIACAALFTMGGIGLLFIPQVPALRELFQMYIGTDYTFVSGIFVFAGLLALIAAAFMVLLVVFAYKTVEAIAGVARTGMYNGGISMFMIVMLFILAASNLLTVFNWQNAIQIPAALLSGATALLLGMLLRKLKNDLSRLPLTPVAYPGFRQDGRS